MTTDTGERYHKELAAELDKITARFKQDLQAIRSNRPSVELLENIKVNYYDQMLSIKELGSLSVVPPREITINVWDKTAVKASMNAIEGANVGLSVRNDGNVIHASLPVLTDERREELTRLVKKTAETARIQVRSKRDDFIKKVKGAADAKQISEDAGFKAKEMIQKLINDANAAIETSVQNKVNELQ